MPYTKNKKGESIFLTPLQLKIREEEFIDPETGDIDKDRFENGSYKPGRHPNHKKNHFGKGADNPNQPGMEGLRTGSKNKKTIQQEILDQGFMTPSEFLVQVYNDETVNMNQRMDAAGKAAPFVEPKLSSIELHTDENHAAPFQILLNVSKEGVELAKNISKDKDEKEDNSEDSDKKGDE